MTGEGSATPAGGSGGRIAWGGWLLVSLLVIAADQFTKLRVTEALELYERVPVLPFFDLVRLHNTGAAFSFLAGASGWQNWLFTAVAVVVSAAVFWWLTRLPRKGRDLLALGLALLLGGAIGNLIDRLLYGHVVDFLLLHYQGWSWPAFNLADSAITGGVLLVLFDGLVLDRYRNRS
ncbi:MAG: lipoprotein signal peptidase [Gammaproteobacteria bacterium]|nr:lipoprotein signal peptidase [Gammaproteobacteria bacterium]